MIAILDYGSGNIRSAERAFAYAGHPVVVTADPKKIALSDGLVIPGVGSFNGCMSGLLSVGGDDIIRHHLSRAKPLFGICVGMQILCETGEETHSTAHSTLHSGRGLGLLPGHVAQLSHPRIPHMGWNTVSTHPQSKLFLTVNPDERFYFVHSYAVKAIPGNSDVIATTVNYGETFIAAMERGLISATQFHPEKSGRAGLELIQRWIKQL